MITAPAVAASADATPPGTALAGPAVFGPGRDAGALQPVRAGFTAAPVRTLAGPRTGEEPMNVRRLLATGAPAATILIRLLVGAVFLSEGIQKFLFPDELGAGRFARIGFSEPAFWASFVGVVEITAGTLVLLGLVTRLAAVALAIDMLAAIATTKVPILLGRDLGPFQVQDLDAYGFWSMAHEARTDWSMLLGSLFLLIAGAGSWSLDAVLQRATRTRSAAADS